MVLYRRKRGDALRPRAIQILQLRMVFVTLDEAKRIDDLERRVAQIELELNRATAAFNDLAAALAELMSPK